MTIEEIKARVSLKDEFERRGIKLIAAGPNKFKCCCPIHKDKNPSLEIDDEKGLWNCFGCNTGGSVLDLLMKADGMSFRDAFLKLGGDKAVEREWRPEPGGASGGEEPKILKTYSYHDANGKEVFQVCRCTGKKFFQRHQVEGQWVNNMQGVERVLYHLPEVLRASEVWIVEGEKDADTLVGLGLCATCNVGGAGKWLDGYTESLAGKDVVVCGDNDKPGDDHAELVLKSISEKVKTSRRARVPSPFKDVTEWAESFKDGNGAVKSAVLSARDTAQVLFKGVDLPILTMPEMEAAYIHHVQHVDEVSLSLSRWLPTLNRIRKLIPGEVVTFIADTGVGKTALLSHVAFFARPLKVLMFEMELPETLLFERFIQQAGRLKSDEVEGEYRRGVGWTEGIAHFLNHIFCCPKSGLDIGEMERILNHAELKMGERPRVVLIDYIQLCRAAGKTRYETMAAVAESIKVMAKRTQTIVVCGSQMARKPSDEKGVGLHDAKGAGEIENSSGLVIGAMREPNSNTMRLKILKNTKGLCGLEIECNFDGATMSITERVVEHSASKPKRTNSNPYPD
jgi:hypothetical protein